MPGVAAVASSQAGLHAEFPSLFATFAALRSVAYSLCHFFRSSYTRSNNVAKLLIIFKTNKKTAVKLYLRRHFLLFGRKSYHKDRRSALGTNILSPSFTPNASYHISICGKAPLTRQRPSEWGSLLVRLRISASVTLPAHTPA